MVSVCEVDHSPLWSNVLPEDQSLRGFIRPEVLESGKAESENLLSSQRCYLHV